ncbi:hypothetical protein RBU49_02995 [Clostridium sp. MB40-C1]|uniref:hypothetical protein n=1 Tax=Clostridium sp. MB40-C1 TaxID=3070996 RepID=UPI0027DF3FFC|nr:hypothetical protein [Clostridium sp. MB40-C1]WMJ81237.1 hypothetical protein RBU49_02995 [Clostridium sp. MB40-C1]
MALFINDGFDITEITNKELKNDFLKCKVGDTFTEDWGDKIYKYQIAHIAQDDDKDTHIIAEEINVQNCVFNEEHKGIYYIL